MSTLQDELGGARSRVAERFGTAEPPTVLARLPAEVVRDSALNLARVLDGETAILARGDRLLIAVGVAAAAGGAQLGAWLGQAALVAGKSASDCEAARAVAFTAATYNGYYKFRSLLHIDGAPNVAELEAFQPALRATPFVRSALSKVLVELICVTVSVMNACAHCTSGHVQAAAKAGASAAMIDEAVRIGAVISALARAELA